VRRGPDTLGHFLVTAATRVSRPRPEQRRVAVLLADQVAGVLDGDPGPPRSGAARPHGHDALPADGTGPPQR
jgi:hypothetical protein